MGQPKRPLRTRSTARPVQISAVVIAKDEECHIAELADSLRGAVDEMVLLDTGSTDDTVALAEAHGFQVFHKPWTDSFAEARNAALAHATGHWVLSIDADERLVTAHHDDLRALVAVLNHADGGDQAAGFWIGVDCFSSDDLDPRAMDRYQQIRLFRRARFHYEGRIHEQLCADAPQPPALFLRAPETIRLAHFGYTPAIMKSKSKLGRNRALIEAALADTSQSAEGAMRAAHLRYERARLDVSPNHIERVDDMLDALAELPADTELYWHGTSLAARTLVESARYDQVLTLLHKSAVPDEYVTTVLVSRATALARTGHDLLAATLLSEIEASANRYSSELDMTVRLPALKAELLAGCDDPTESWRALVALTERPLADFRPTAAGIADRVWHRAVAAGRPDSYLQELAAGTDDGEFYRVLALLPEEHQRAAAGTRHVLAHGRLVEPDPRLEAFLPRLAAHSVAAGLELGRSRLDTDPALVLGIADELSRRTDAAELEVDAAQLLAVRALLLLNHVARAIVFADTLPTAVARSAADEALHAALRRMARDIAQELGVHAKKLRQTAER